MKSSVSYRNKLILFVILIFFVGKIFSQTADYGKSYFNVTKGVNGGTVEPGDVLEVRGSFVVRNTGFFDSCAFNDVIPTGTTYIAGSLCVLTNEGKVYKQFTDAQFGAAPYDEGWISGSNVRINLGYNQTDAPATVYRRGRIRNTHKPLFSGNTCIMMASYRVTVNAAFNSTINMGGGTVSYKLGSNPITTITFPSNLVMVYPNYGICQNTIGGNTLGTEFNGTFGSGKPRNRGTSANVPPSYTYAPFTTSGPNDYYYGIANNTSTRTNYTTLNTWAKPDNSSPSHRVFSLWDIIGDHTGASSLTAGNPAADTVNNSNGGYMLVINASYRIDSAFQQTITNLCPNTYYEISCWMRNICSKCGTDSNGKSATNSTGPPYYIPTGTGDSSGVKPSIIFEIDGIDYFSTGQLEYSNQWERKAFTFLTGPAQTTINLKFNNNAPGGGGNDWALDDIAVATCTPNMTYSPTVTPIVCDSNTLTVTDTIRSFFNNYTYYKWQRSTDGGVTWIDITAPVGPVSPYWNGTAWQYFTTYTIPVTQTTLADSADLYRVLTATTLANLSNSNCSLTEATNIITLSVINCGTLLGLKFISVSGKTDENNKAVLHWITSNENEPLEFIIQKSLDGINFSDIGSVFNSAAYNQQNDTYDFKDDEAITDKAFYRIAARNRTGKLLYTRIIYLSGKKLLYNSISVNNPFNDNITIRINSIENTRGEIIVYDIMGNTVIKREINLTNGFNNVAIDNTNHLIKGTYLLQFKTGSSLIYKKLVKL